MNNRIYRWYKGYVRVKIISDNKERFINLCCSNKICLYDIEKYDNKVFFSVDINSYKKLKRIARKTHIIPRIYNKIGVPFIMQKLSKRRSFPVGIIIGIIIFYISSLYVWDISIDGENYYTECEILEYLESNDIKHGMQLKNISCKEIEDLIRNKYNDIGWVSACVKGTRLMISIKENVKFKDNITNVKSRHIISPVDGIVKSVVVKKGENIVNIGDVVKKGQILISGIKEIYNDAGEIIKKYGVDADADITIQRDMEYYYQIKKQYDKLIYTGKNNNKIEIRIAKKDIYSIGYLIHRKKIDNFDIIVNNYNVSLGQKLELPVEIIQYKEREYKKQKDIYTEKQLIKKAKQHLKIYQEELKKQNMSIIKTNIDYNIDSTTLYAKGYVTVLYRNMDYKNVDKNELIIKDKNE